MVSPKQADQPYLIGMLIKEWKSELPEARITITSRHYERLLAVVESANRLDADRPEGSFDQTPLDDLRQALGELARD